MVDYTVDVALEDIRFTRAHAHERGRIAILSERETVRWIALLSQLFLDADVQVFGDEPAARDWLGPGVQELKRMAFRTLIQVDELRQRLDARIS